MIGKTALLALFVAASGSALAGGLDYFGEDRPGLTPERFQYGNHIPAQYEVVNLLFSADGTEFYFTDNKTRNIYVMTKTASGWAAPVLAPFADKGHNYEPFLTPDGRFMYFVSTRPPGSGRFNGRIWRSERTDGVWAAPTLLIDRDTRDGLWFPNVTPDGKTLYFGATLADSLGEGDFYRATETDGKWRLTHLAPPLNTPDYEWDPLISPDGSYMVLISRRDGGYGATDIYVSFKEADGFGAPINLGSDINGAEWETAATISPDGNYMFYILAPAGQPPEVYWVSTDVIHRLKP